MRLVTRYVGAQFLRVFLVGLLAFLAIYLIVEFFERVDDFLEKGTPFRQAVGYFVYKIPQILMQISPAAILLASVFSLLILGHNNLTRKVQTDSPFRFAEKIAERMEVLLAALRTKFFPQGLKPEKGGQA